MPTSVKILHTEPVTHDVRRYRVEKPDGFSFEPGQATDVAFDKEGWRKGPGVFIAGGAGVTPFIAILRKLAADGRLDGHTLIASHKTEEDIILRDEFEAMPGLTCIWTVTGEESSPLNRGKIDKGFLQHHVESFDQNFYVCGPDQMVDDIKATLKDLGADADGITFEE